MRAPLQATTLATFYLPCLPQPITGRIPSVCALCHHTNMSGIRFMLHSVEPYSESITDIRLISGIRPILTSVKP